MKLATLSRLTIEQRALVALIRAWPPCRVIITVRGGKPVQTNSLGVMLPMPIDLDPPDEIRAGELAVIAACQELGYGTIEMDVASGVIQGWHIGGSEGDYGKGQLIVLSELGGK